MNILLLANWGMGLEIFKALHRHPDVHHMVVVTKYNPASNDPWENALYDTSVRLGYRTIPQDRITFEKLSGIIREEGIDLLFSHAYMKILPDYVFNAPPKRSINIHASLLPRHRGASPAKWVLENRDTQTGLTCHYIDHGVDTGDIICRTAFEVEPDDTVISLIEKGKQKIAALINECLARVIDNAFIPEKQGAA